jgi:hypothetical protein
VNLVRRVCQSQMKLADFTSQKSSGGRRSSALRARNEKTAAADRLKTDLSAGGDFEGSQLRALAVNAAPSESHFLRQQLESFDHSRVQSRVRQ